MSICHFSLLGYAGNYQQIQQELPQLQAQPWTEHVNRRDYQGEWDVLPLRCAAEHQDAHSILQSFTRTDAEHWVDLPVLELAPALKHFLASWPCPVKAARLMRLQPQAVIKPHRDHGLCLEQGEARLHLCLQSNPLLHFYVAGQRVPMQEGQIWYINADQTHSVENLGAGSRINLVLDCVVTPWLKEQVCATAAEQRTF